MNRLCGMLVWLVLGLGLAFAPNANAQFRKPNDPGVRTITIAKSGGQYADLNAACAANTSTAADPIVYRIGPGTYTGQVSCLGEVSAAFIGSGVGVTTLTSTGNSGTLLLGTSTNIEVTGMTIHGTQSIRWLAAGVGGGLMWIHHMEFSNPVDPGNAEDCTFIDTPVAGSRLVWNDNVCRMSVDGLTVSEQAGNVEVYAYNNTMLPLATSAGSMRAFRFNSDPCLAAFGGNTINITQSKTAPFGITGYYFTGEVVGDCAGTSRVFIDGGSSFIRNTTANQPGSGADFIAFLVAAGVDEIYVNGVTAITQASDVDDTLVRGIVLDSSVAAFILNSYISSTGGASNIDIVDGPGTTTVIASLYATDSGTITAGDGRRIAVGQSAVFTDPATITYNTAADGPTGLLLDNTNEGASGGSPCIALRDATVAAGDNDFFLCTDAGGALAFRDDAFTRAATMNQDGSMFIRGSNFRVDFAGGTLYIGNTGASDTNSIVFDTATTDGSMVWNDTLNLFNFTGADQLGIPCVTTMPTCNTAGRVVCDGDGTVGMCFCNGTSYLAMTAGADCT